MGNMYFISVHHSNLEFASEVKQRIEDAGFLGWLMTDIGGGDRWKAVVDNAINESIGVIVIVTPASLKSSWVTYEWAYATGRDKEVIPVVLQWSNGKEDPKSLHEKLADRQYRDFSRSSNLPWEILLDDLRRIRDRTDIPDQIKHAEETLQTGHDPAQWETALEMLRTHPHPQAAEALVRCMANPVDRVSARSAMTLARKSKYQDKRAIPGLGRALKSVEWLMDWSEQIQVAKFLAQYGTEGAISCILDALMSGVIDKNNLRSYVEVVSQFNYDGVINYMIDLLSENNSQIVEIATNTLGRIKDPRALPALNRFLLASEWPRYRICAAKAIGLIGNPDSVDLLLNLLRGIKTTNVHRPDLEVEVANSITRSLINIGTKEALSGLSQIMNDYSADRAVRTTIQRELSNRS